MPPQNLALPVDADWSVFKDATKFSYYEEQLQLEETDGSPFIHSCKALCYGLLAFFFRFIALSMCEIENIQSKFIKR